MTIPERTHYDFAPSSVSSTLRQLVQFANSATGLTVVNQTTQIGFWSDIDGTSQVQRFRERMFIGDATKMGDTRSNLNTTWTPNASVGANWLPRDSMLCVMQSRGGPAITGSSRASDADDVTFPPACIGVTGYVIGDTAVSGRAARAGYFETQFESDSAAAAYGYGIEIQVKNKEIDRTSTPYFLTTGTYGTFLATGPSSYGGVPTFPNNTAILIDRGESLNTWNKGIVFGADALTRDQIFGRANAIELAQYHNIKWYTPGNTLGLTITSGVASGGNGSTLLAVDNGIAFLNASGQNIGFFYNDATNQADNYLTIRPGTSGTMPPRVFAQGTDTDVDLAFVPKGAGVVQFGTHTATPLTISGYVTIKDAGGTTRKLAVVT